MVSAYAMKLVASKCCGLQAIPEKDQVQAVPPVALTILENIKVNNSFILFPMPDHHSKHKNKNYETVLIILHDKPLTGEQKLIDYSFS